VSIQEARRQIGVANKQLGRVQAASREPDDDDREVAATWAFYAYENCVVAVAEALERPWQRVHQRKADLARALYREGIVSRDLRETLEELNEIRKNVQYGEPGLELLDLDLEELASQLKAFYDEALQIIEKADA